MNNCKAKQSELVCEQLQSKAKQSKVNNFKRNMVFNMFESIQDCIKNCVAVEQGHYVLFRDFGLRTVDKPINGLSIKSQLIEQINMFYPEYQLERSSNLDYTFTKK